MDIISLYSTEEIIDKSCHDIVFSNTSQERDVTVKPCLKEKRVNMDTSSMSFSPYFYIHLPIIYKLRVLIPFTSFKVEFLTATNVAHSRVTLNVCGILRAFQIVCCSLR